MSNLITKNVNVISGELLPEDKSLSTIIRNTEGRGEILTPAEVYVKKHSTEESKRVALIKAKEVAYLLGYTNPNHIEWDQITYSDAINLRSALSTAKNAQGDALAPSTVNHTIIAFRQMAKSAWLQGIINHDDHAKLRSIELIPGSRRKIRHLPMSREVEMLIDVCFQDPSVAGARDAAMITLAFGAGLRRSEIVNIKYPDHIITRNLALHVRGKGNKERIMPLEPYMLDVVNTWVFDVRGEQPGPLFSRIRKGDDILPDKLTPAAVRYIFEQRCLQAGISIIRPHDARSTYATNLLSNGTTLVTVRNLLGHSSVTTTERYVQVEQDEKISAVNKNLTILDSIKNK